jgi:hypothetical protein
MRGIIQREYDAWREQHGLRTRPVRQIEESELRTIYRANYWDEMGCDSLPAGLDMAVFDAAVNSGVGRARVWLKALAQHEGPTNAAEEIQQFTNERLEFLKRLGKLWRVFGLGWERRCLAVQADCLRMVGSPAASIFTGAELHAGMTGEAVTRLQTRLRDLGYPVGEVDGFYGEQLRRAVILFQDDNELEGQPGAWPSSYEPYLAKASHMLPKRRDVTRGDLEAKGDKSISRLNGLQRLMGWIFGGSVVAGVMDGSSVLDSVQGAREALEPLEGLLAWSSGHAWIAVALAAVALITLFRLMRADHVRAYQSFTYQGASPDHA